MAGRDLMTIDVEVVGGLGEVRLSGRLMAESRFEIERILRDWNETGVNHAVVSLAGLDYVDSAGLSTLIGAMHKMRRAGGELVLCELNPALDSLFEITSIHNYFQLFVTFAEARAHIKSLIKTRRTKGRPRSAAAASPKKAKAAGSKSASKATPAKAKPAKAKASKTKASKAKPAKGKASKATPAKRKAAKAKPAKGKASKAKPAKRKAAQAKPAKGRASKAKPAKKARKSSVKSKK